MWFVLTPAIVAPRRLKKALATCIADIYDFQVKAQLENQRMTTQSGEKPISNIQLFIFSSLLHL